TEKASPLGICDSNLRGASGGLTLCQPAPLPDPPSFPPSASANRGNYTLNCHLVYTLNCHQLQQCDTRTNMRNLTLLCLALPELAVYWGGSREHLLMEGKLALTLTRARGMTGWREM
ncbi:uncharacterized, partial [Tachysurus ichikawai]